MRRKGQVTAEFVVILAIISIIFLVSINFIVKERKLMSQGVWAVDAQDNAYRLSEAISSCHLAGPGAALNLSLPYRLSGGVNYTITVYPRLVAVKVPAHEHEFEWKFVTADVNGSVGGLVVQPGIIEMENVNGTVYVRSR